MHTHNLAIYINTHTLGGLCIEFTLRSRAVAAATTPKLITSLARACRRHTGLDPLNAALYSHERRGPARDRCSTFNLEGAFRFYPRRRRRRRLGPLQ